nr:MAG TPA: hypothetical protein [Caudoviricetes sp.]
MANARASRKKMDYPADVEARLDDFRALVLAQFIDAGLSAFKDGRKVGGPSDRYFYNKLVRGSLNIKDMILLNDYLPIDWTLILKTMRRPKDVLRPVDTEPAPVDVVFADPGDDPFAAFFTDVDGV